MNSTETPGGSGIPAGWYDDPGGQGLRWWDGERWTEHVHTAESAAATAESGVGAGEREAPPPQLVRLRESIQAKGAKGVGMVLGGLVLVIVVIALLVSGGSDDNGKGAQSGNATPTVAQPILQKEIKALRRQLNSPNIPKAEKKALQKQLKKLEREAGGSKSGKSGKGQASKEKTPSDEEGN